MSKLIAFLSASLVLTVLSSNVLAASLNNETAWAVGTKWKYETNFHGLKAWVYTPEVGTKKVPEKKGVVFHFMGCGQMAYQIAQGIGWDAVADEYGLIVVVPEPKLPAKPNKIATQIECFNYSFTNSYNTPMTPPNTQDHKDIVAAARALAKEASIDPSQIYATGLSAGAAFATQVMCMAPDAFSGGGIAAGPTMGSHQDRAVRAPSEVGATLPKIKTDCEKYATATHKDKLKDLVFAVVSDDNSLPVGNVVSGCKVNSSTGALTGCQDGGFNETFSFNLFLELPIWDGDKFTPYIYNKWNAQGFADIIGLGTTPTGVDQQVLDHTTGLPLSGAGVGCTPKTANPIDTWDSTSEVPSGVTNISSGKTFMNKWGCPPKDAKYRNWEAKSDVWLDSEGRTRVIQIKMDTLRHAWPTTNGRKNPSEYAAGYARVSPSYDDLKNDGYAIYEDGDLNGDGTTDSVLSYFGDKVNLAKNGVLGVVYFNPLSFNYAKFLANFWNENNPKLPMGPSNKSPEVEVSATVEGYTLTVFGTATDSDGSIASSTLLVKNQTSGKTIVDGALVLSKSGTFSEVFADLQDGAYQIEVTATDDMSAITTAKTTSLVGTVPNQFPVIDTIKAETAEEDCIKISGTASDADGSVVSVAVTVMGEGIKAATLNEGAFSVKVCGLIAGTYTATAVATDDAEGRSLVSEVAEVVLKQTGCGVKATWSEPLVLNVGYGSSEKNHVGENHLAYGDAKYNLIRAEHCNSTGGVTWTCVDTFKMYQCEGVGEWYEETVDGIPEKNCGSSECPEIDVDMAISSKATAEVESGVGVTVKLTVSNESASNASGVAVTLAIPVGLSVTSADCEKTTSVCHVGGVAAGQSKTIDLLVKASSAGELLLTTTVQSAQNDTVLANNTHSINIIASASEDGDPDGDVDGSADGDVDGSADGDVDGSADGDVDGSADGDVDGSADGDVDGSADGDVDGSADGDVDGSADGDVDGSADGDVDGGVDGDVDGGADGDVDGSADGDVDGGADGDIDGSADGDVDGSVDGDVDGSADGDVDGSADGSGDEGGGKKGGGGSVGLLALLAFGLLGAGLKKRSRR